MPSLRLPFPLTIAVALGAAACTSARRAAEGPKPPVPTPPAVSTGPARPVHDPCAVVSPAPIALGVPTEAPLLPDSIVVGLTTPLDPAHAPVPHTEGERLLFAQLYETLLRIDCTGEVRPGLATAWRRDSSGRRWTFTLREGARFSDGSAVTALDVVTSWRARRADGGAPDPLAAVVGRGATAVGPHTLAVTLDDSIATLASAALFASPALAVARRGSDTDAWPAGTGPYRVATHGPNAGALTLLLPGDSAPPRQEPPRGAAVAGGRNATPSGALMVPPAPGSGGRMRLVVRLASSRDARDLLDAGVDVLVTGDPSVVQYAAESGLATVPLPWQATYVLLVPARARGALSGASLDSGVWSDDSSVGSSLVAAVHASARPAAGPFWWRSATGPEQTVDSVGPAAVEPEPRRPADRPARLDRRVLYERGDRTARDLAERVVALAASRGGSLIAAGVDGTELARILAAGTSAGYVLALPRSVALPRLAVRALLREAPWLSAPAALDRALVPLVDTRPTAIVRWESLTGVTMVVDQGATVRFVGPWRPAGEDAARSGRVR
jgi:hypothetical protein